MYKTIKRLSKDYLPTGHDIYKGIKSLYHDDSNSQPHSEVESETGRVSVCYMLYV